MREIKFRAWYPNEGMRSFDEIKGDCIGALFHATGIKYMQFTGLKDKNGKEIYEGDIVELINPTCQVQKKRISGVVVFGWASFGIAIEKVDVWEGYNVEPPQTVWFLNIENSGALSEVIGNIYENPELITRSAAE